MIFSLISRNVAGQTKKSLTLTMTFVYESNPFCQVQSLTTCSAWAAGNMTAPQIFQSGDAPRYTKGFTAHFCLYGVFNATLVVTRLLISRRNAQKRAAMTTGELAGPEVGDVKITHAFAFEDLTDRENGEFRYVL
jgi:hypothetical protein